MSINLFSSLLKQFTILAFAANIMQGFRLYGDKRSSLFVQNIKDEENETFFLNSWNNWKSKPLLQILCKVIMQALWVPNALAYLSQTAKSKKMKPFFSIISK